ncbi:hypothetical protein [Saccharopolyspora shandongensis]|uniref:hypothetical protein n=1 Tax=Saccharopolyspora shandongensis TaxID=418495 RepID=UPI0033F56FFE
MIYPRTAALFEPVARTRPFSCAPCDTAVGDFEDGFDAAAIKVDQHYTTPYEFSQALEPPACAVPHSEDLTVYAATTPRGDDRGDRLRTQPCQPRASEPLIF